MRIQSFQANLNSQLTNQDLVTFDFQVLAVVEDERERGIVWGLDVALFSRGTRRANIPNGTLDLPETKFERVLVDPLQQPPNESDSQWVTNWSQ